MEITEEVKSAIERLETLNTKSGLPNGAVHRFFEAVFKNLKEGGEFDEWARDIAQMPVNIEPGRSRLFIDKLYLAVARCAQAEFFSNAGNELSAWKALYCASLDNGAAMALLVSTLDRMHLGKQRGKAGADALHNMPGGSRDKAAKMRALWASGNFANRDLCAEQECAALGMSFSSARKALVKTPDPA